MSLVNMQIILTAFGFGIVAGSLLSYFLMKRTLKKNMKSFSRFVSTINVQSKETNSVLNERKENLTILANKLKQIESNIQSIRNKEITSHIQDLNQLLSEKGIGKIDGTGKQPKKD